LGKLDIAQIKLKRRLKS